MPRQQSVPRVPSPEARAYLEALRDVCGRECSSVGAYRRALVAAWREYLRVAYAPVASGIRKCDACSKRVSATHETTCVLCKADAATALRAAHAQQAACLMCSIGECDVHGKRLPAVPLVCAECSCVAACLSDMLCVQHALVTVWCASCGAAGALDDPEWVSVGGPLVPHDHSMICGACAACVRCGAAPGDATHPHASACARCARDWNSHAPLCDACHERYGACRVHAIGCATCRTPIEPGAHACDTCAGPMCETCAAESPVCYPCPLAPETAIGHPAAQRPASLRVAIIRKPRKATASPRPSLGLKSPRVVESSPMIE